MLSARKRISFIILLIVEEGRSSEEMDATAMSGYMSGMDFLLIRPLSKEEFTNFARRALQLPT
ncbi:MAG: hypothetical protein H8F28_18250 [Fibrella sp.]|nr:hypothetical protein [Armatimonadota bacterium]